MSDSEEGSYYSEEEYRQKIEIICNKFTSNTYVVLFYLSFIPKKKSKRKRRKSLSMKKLKKL